MIHLIINRLRIFVHFKNPLLNVSKNTHSLKMKVKQKKQEADKLNNLLLTVLCLATLVNGIEFKTVHFFSVNVST